MRKVWMVLHALLLLIFLSACGAKENTQYYMTKRYMEQPTGDITLTEYTYDAQWNLLSSRNLLNGEFASSVDYTYSEDDSVVTMTTSSAIYDSDVTEVHRTFDEQGRVVEALAYADGALVTTAQYTYDDQGREIKAVGTVANGYVNTVEHVYDKNGNLLTYLTDTGFATARQEYTYDSHNRRISAEYYQNDQLTNRVQYTYDNGVQKGIYCDAEGVMLRTVFSTFDQAGNLLTEESFDSMGNRQSCTRYAYVGTDGSESSGIPKTE